MDLGEVRDAIDHGHAGCGATVRLVRKRLLIRGCSGPLRIIRSGRCIDAAHAGIELILVTGLASL